ncbi:MAG TPA: 3-dehydroquinate synthase [Peptococcaceae bacterium]|jgi:3-dehydroquinate synthase|nr:3-dehydroquinate synthase [Clostridia bacterium]HOB82223.1 3-dehydroquinate synthase [Peptococcaceae bacterium]HPZ71346.1 3-dehydroquinate synthase [Peptococcaceae bacterium]HQD54124.1 3-dehydroquinate synthase [Peptococcaceae bacterium]
MKKERTEHNAIGQGVRAEDALEPAALAKGVGGQEALEQGKTNPAVGVSCRRVKVRLAERSYEVLLGTEIWPAGVAELQRFSPEEEVFVVTDERVHRLYGEELTGLLEEAGYRPFTYILEAGEASKTWVNAEKILDSMLARNFSRQVPLLALGGGVVGDLAGFVAALYRRGVPFIQIPTTLLAQVDSSVGGKVAVNHPRGKNMLGTFYQPRAVWADLRTLDTLDEREWQAGLAEVLKYALLWDAGFFTFLETHAREIIARDNPPVLAAMIERCVQIKAEIVRRDERDEGLRHILNLGHTIGHALEKATGFQQYRHGEAVAIGMRAAGMLAVKLGLFSAAKLARVEKLMQEWGLPMNLSGSTVREIPEQIKLDKKVANKEVAFVLPVAIGKVTVQKGIAEEILMQVLEELAEK